LSTRNKSGFDAKPAARKKLKKPASHTKPNSAPQIRPTPIPIRDGKRSIKKIRKTFSAPASKVTNDDKGSLTGIATTERDISEPMGSMEKFGRMATVIQGSNDAITCQIADVWPTDTTLGTIPKLNGECS